MKREEKENLIIRALIIYEAMKSASEDKEQAELPVDCIENTIKFTLDNEFDIGNIHFTKHIDEV